MIHDLSLNLGKSKKETFGIDLTEDPLYVGGVSEIMADGDREVFTLNLVSRERAGGTTTQTGFSACNDNGVATFRQSGKYHRIEIKIPANAVWNDAMGLEIEATVDGVQ